MIQKVVEVLRKGWTKGAYARDAKGADCSPFSEEAVCWCVAGAMQVAIGPYTERLRLEELFKEKHKIKIVAFNDTAKNVEEVIAALLELS